MWSFKVKHVHFCELISVLWDSLRKWDELIFIGKKGVAQGVSAPWLRGWQLVIGGPGIEPTSPACWQKCKMPNTRISKSLGGIIWILCRIGVSNNCLGNTNKRLNHVGVVSEVPHFEKIFIYDSLKLGDKTVVVLKEYNHR